MSMDPKARKNVKDLFRATFYITHEDDLKLERIRMARRARGQKTDRSAIVREAIALLPEA